MLSSEPKIHSLADLAAARATCRLAAAARRSQARRGAQPTQDAGLHPRPRLCPAHGRLAARVRGRRAVVEDPGSGGQKRTGAPRDRDALAIDVRWISASVRKLWRRGTHRSRRSAAVPTRRP